MKHTKVPVLFITFARPEYARKSFNAIKNAKPKKLYFYSNKARVEKKDEVLRNEQIRSFVNEIDWECELFTFFREEYVDVYESLWSAIDWIFEHEERAIILEEDCVASKAFFNYSEDMLNKYESESRIWVISGNNFFDEYKAKDSDIIFSRHPYKYGWASWRNRWLKIERKNVPWSDIVANNLHCLYYSISGYKLKLIKKQQKKIIDFLASNSAWDYYFDFTMLVNDGYGIVPSQNLVSNIGQVGNNNNGIKTIFHNKEIYSKDEFSVKKFPKFLYVNYEYDQYVIDVLIQSFTITGKIKIKLQSKFHHFKTILRKMDFRTNN